MWETVRRRLRCLLALGTLLLCPLAIAQQEALAKLFANLLHEDFRVRTQAALALGASKDPRAPAPLCKALEDVNASVRAAAAAALGRLALGGEECLDKRLASEPSAAVKSAIEKALELLDGGEPVFTPEARYYVALGKVSDKSGRTGNVAERLVRKGFVSAGAADGSLVFAPRHENPQRAKERVRRRPNVKGFYLAPRLPPFEYADGSLTVRLEIALFSYPDKSMVGNYSVRLTQPDVTKPDPDSENELVSMCAERAIEKFARIAASL